MLERMSLEEGGRCADRRREGWLPQPHAPAAAAVSLQGTGTMQSQKSWTPTCFTHQQECYLALKNDGKRKEKWGRAKRDKIWRQSLQILRKDTVIIVKMTDANSSNIYFIIVTFQKYIKSNEESSFFSAESTGKRPSHAAGQHPAAFLKGKCLLKKISSSKLTCEWEVYINATASAVTAGPNWLLTLQSVPKQRV